MAHWIAYFADAEHEVRPGRRHAMTLDASPPRRGAGPERRRASCAPRGESGFAAVLADKDTLRWPKEVSARVPPLVRGEGANERREGPRKS